MPLSMLICYNVGAMEFFLAFITAFGISFLITIPAGPLVMLCMNRAISRDLRSAIITATGATVSDAVYAIIAASGFLATHSFFQYKHPVLGLLGGTILVAFGLFTIGVEPPLQSTESHDDRGNFISGFLLAFANPGTIAGFAAVFAVLKNTDSSLLHPVTLVLGLVAGSFACLALVSTFVHKIKHLLSKRALRTINTLAGIAIGATGMFFVMHAI